MKTRLALWLALLLWIPVPHVARAADGRNYAADMSVNADVQEAFFKRYPDLAEEREMVAQAARALAIEGMAATNDTAAAKILATRTRELLARRTPQEWQRKAVSLYPELGVAGSEFNALFLRHYEEMRRSSPDFVKEPSWPVLLAKRCADELKKVASVVAVPSGPAAAAPAPGNAPVSPAMAPPRATKRGAFWLATLNVVLLLAIVVQPARLLFRARRMFGGAVTVWQQALGPAAWTYLIVAVIALFRTFFANADQGFVDRFGVTLLVSLLVGVVSAAPVYLVALWVMFWRSRRTKAAA